MLLNLFLKTVIHFWNTFIEHLLCAGDRKVIDQNFHGFSLVCGMFSGYFSFHYPQNTFLFKLYINMILFLYKYKYTLTFSIFQVPWFIILNIHCHYIDCRCRQSMQLVWTKSILRMVWKREVMLYLIFLLFDSFS